MPATDGNATSTSQTKWSFTGRQNSSVSEEPNCIFTPSSGFEEGTFDSSGFSAEVTLISASVVPHSWKRTDRVNDQV